MTTIFSIALGGACGALARYGAGLLVRHLVDAPFPWATWTVNLVGCFLIGASLPLLSALPFGDQSRIFLVVGFLGSFTTFSTYSLDTLSLATNGHAVLALANAAGSVVAGLLCVWLGRMTADLVVAG
jgi:CrcB protein